MEVQHIFSVLFSFIFFIGANCQVAEMDWLTDSVLPVVVAALPVADAWYYFGNVSDSLASDLLPDAYMYADLYDQTRYGKLMSITLPAG